MLKDVEPAAQGSEGLFSALVAPRLAFIRQRLAQEPLRVSLAFAAVMLGLSLLLTLGQIRAAGNGALVDLVPSETVFCLLIGAAVFPPRMLHVPVAAYVLCFSAAFLTRMAIEPGYVPAGLDAVGVYLVAMTMNAVPGLAGGLIAQVAAARIAPAAGRRDVALSLVAALAYIALAGLGVGLVTGGVLPWLDWPVPDFGDLSALQAGLIRAARIGLCGAVLLLYVLDRPDLRQLRRALVVLPLFLAVGALRVMGWSVHPTLDVEMLALAVALLAPAPSAILSVILGVLGYVVVTGEFLVQIPVVSVDLMRLEVASLMLLSLIFLLLLQRHGGMVERRMNRAAIDRFARVQALATIGYFVTDAQSGEVQVDRVAQSILSTGPRFDLPTFLVRVRPSDRVVITGALAERQLQSVTLSFLLGAGEEWQDDGQARYVSVHAWYEMRADGATLIYGALIDLTDDHRREVALADALSKLSEQQDRQTQLFSIVSHELRTPASVIAMLVEELDGGAHWAEMGPRLRAVSDQLLSVLADMRQTVRPEQNPPVRMDVLIPQDLATAVRNTFLLMAEAKGVEIDLDLSPDAWSARVSDRVRLMQALSNLVKNALLHAECRRITIGYTEETGTGGISGLWRVMDDGRGIPPETRATLFDAFRRGAGRSTARTDGSGLGLYVTKSSIELLGGTVTHAPRAAGGSVFVLRVPMGEPEAQEETGAAPSRAAAAGPAPSAQTVLIAEDSDLMGELLVARLKRVFGRVVWARDGEEALQLFAREAPDVVLTDLFMPKMGGDELTAALRQRGADCPVIGMTAAAIGDDRERFEAAGTDCVLTKPVSVGQLMEVLDGLRPRAVAG